MREQRCETCVYASWHRNYDKAEPILCINDKSERFLDFMNAYDGCNYYDSGKVKQLMSEVQEELSQNADLYDTLVSNIASTLKELPKESNLEDVAKAVADRIIERAEE